MYWDTPRTSRSVNEERRRTLVERRGVHSWDVVQLVNATIARKRKKKVEKLVRVDTSDFYTSHKRFRLNDK